MNDNYMVLYVKDKFYGDGVPFLSHLSGSGSGSGSGPFIFPSMPLEGNIVIHN